MHIEGTFLEYLLANHFDPGDYYNYKQRLASAIEARDEYESGYGTQEYSEFQYDILYQRVEELQERVNELEEPWKSTTDIQDVNMDKEMDYIEYYIEHEDEFLDEAE
jgi:hypothetical protein